MKSKLIFASILVSLFIGLMVSQVKVVNAESSNSPLTTPISYFEISGKVTYRLGNIVRPAVGAFIKVIGNTGIFIIPVNSDGSYSTYLTAGEYKVQAQDHRSQTTFYPTTRIVDLREASASGVNFQGLVSTGSATPSN
ncbi:hypothetical protein HY025_06325 [Candidatus Daviesbacteria bacterium]|nr:hypothetical protein [Candidatus Daviesbacteria bacterium]